ncbi:MAG: cofactor-independent phosphoglycerate mutase [Firmicutes bacterium]|nr:cofactor-independent phosphoglycerate mutase [Bacillota bacterium]
MKYIVMLCDGMAGYPLEKYDGKTTMEMAEKPNMDALCKKSIVGMIRTVPAGMKPGSDVANLAAMGYDATKCYTGRSPLEAMSIGIDMKETDIAMRCNLVTLSEDEEYENKVMADYSSEEISTEEAGELIKVLNENLSTEELEFFRGISYRHCLIWHNGPKTLELTPPHDISDRVVTEYLPKNEILLNMMKKSYGLLKDHPVNVARREKGLNPANSIWLWGEGTRPAIPNFTETYNLDGSVISAVDLIKGIGITAGLEVIEVEGATGNITTNFANKGKAALKTLLDGKDYVYIHVEAADECGHRGEAENKVKSIEFIDRDVIGPLLKGLEEAGEEYTIMIMPDHPTPIALKTHTSDPVPFMIYRSNKEEKGIDTFTEKKAAETGIFYETGMELVAKFFEYKN